MSEQKSEPKPFVFDEESDSALIGGKKFRLKRDKTMLLVEELTQELVAIETETEIPNNPKITEVEARSDRWVKRIFNDLLVDFDNSVRAELNPQQGQVLASQIFWACRRTIPFLALHSVNLSATAVPKAKLTP